MDILLSLLLGRIPTPIIWWQAVYPVASPQQETQRRVSWLTYDNPVIELLAHESDKNENNRHEFKASWIL